MNYDRLAYPDVARPLTPGRKWPEIVGRQRCVMSWAYPGKRPSRYFYRVIHKDISGRFWFTYRGDKVHCIFRENDFPGSSYWIGVGFYEGIAKASRTFREQREEQ